MTSGRSTTLVFLALSLALGACGRSKTTAPVLPPGTNRLSNTLTFRRDDGTLIPMGRTYAVCCSTWEIGTIDHDALKIFFYDPTKHLSYWKLFVIPSEILDDNVFALPTPGPGDGAVALVVNDVGNGNEASGAAPGSSGNVRIQGYSCGPPTSIDVTIDAVLGSDVSGGAPIHVQGRLTATVSTNPISCIFGF